MTPDYKKALEKLTSPPIVLDLGDLSTIRCALQIADAVMKGPSEGMLSAGYEELGTEAVWKAMRDQLIKEAVPGGEDGQ